MSNFALAVQANRRTLPDGRALAGLSVLVLLAHALVLHKASSQLGVALDMPPAQGQADRSFVTRRIPAEPAPELAAPEPVAQPFKRPVFKSKSPEIQSTRTRSAIISIATPSTSMASGAAPDGTPDPATVTDPTLPASEATPAATGSPDVAPVGATETPSATVSATASTSTSAPPMPVIPQTTPVTAMALPASAQLAYKMTGSAKGLNYHANAELEWLNRGSHYEARMSVSALFLGSRNLTSQGQLSPDGLAPLRFSDKSRSEVAAHFEADKGQISFSANTPNAPWIKGSQDRVSVFFQLGGMLAGNPQAFPVGSRVVIYTVGPRDADTWTFLVEAEETIQLPFGDLSTIKLTRQPRREYDQKVEIWYAPALGFLPVRNKITQHNGDFVDQQLSAVSRP